MTTSAVTCSYCGSVFQKENREINRARKRGVGHFCNLRCLALLKARSKKAREIVMTCPCGTRFQTDTKKKSAKHCSRSCASKYSMNDDRRAAQHQAGLATGNLIPVAEALRQREAWKYCELDIVLQGRPHQFECKVGGYVFDLALFDTKTLVEFDGPYHRNTAQCQVDRDKEKAATEAGFVVVRRQVKPSTIIGTATIEGL